MDEQCLICLQGFHFEYDPSYVICQRQHLYCIICYEQIRKDRNKNQNCPICRTAINFKAPKTFTPEIFCSKRLNQIRIKHQQQTKKEKIKIISIISELFEFEKQANCSILSFVKSFAISLMKSNDFYSAAYVLKETVERYDVQASSQEILGLGSIVEEEGLSQNKGYEWYQKRYGSNMSLFDLFGISMMKADTGHQDKIKVTQQMHLKNPKSDIILYYFAVSKLNAHKITQAEKFLTNLQYRGSRLNRINLMKAQISFNRGEMLAAEEYSRLYLIRDPDNIAARLLHTASVKQSKSSKDFKFLQLMNFQPQYAKVLYFLARTQDSKKAVDLYEQCIAMNKGYLSAYLRLGALKSQKGEAKGILMDLLINKRLTDWQQFICFRQLGIIYFNLFCYNTSVQLLLKAQLFHNQSNQIISLIVQCYYRLERTQQVLKHGGRGIWLMQREMKTATEQEYKNLKQYLFIIFHHMILVYLSREQYSQAIMMLKNWEEYSPEQHSQYINIIKIRKTQMKSDDKLYKWYQSCLFHKYKIGDAVTSLLDVLLKNKRYDKIEEVIEECQSCEKLPKFCMNRLEYYTAKIIHLRKLPCQEGMTKLQGNKEGLANKIVPQNNI